MNDDNYPQLDSISFNLKYKQINTNTVIEKPITYKQKLITTSPSITAGYDPINKNWSVMVGVSVNFNIWNSGKTSKGMKDYTK